MGEGEGLGEGEGVGEMEVWGELREVDGGKTAVMGKLKTSMRGKGKELVPDQREWDLLMSQRLVSRLLYCEIEHI